MENDKKTLKNILGWLRAIILGILIAFVIKFFLVDLTQVKGRSMDHTLHDGDLMMVNRIENWMGKDYERGDIVIVESPAKDKLYIKRVIGLPGEQVELEDGYFYINGEKLEEDYLDPGMTTPQTGEFFAWFLGDDDYFLVGDNRVNSNDSRNFGPIKRKSFKGQAFLRIYPFSKMGGV